MKAAKSRWRRGPWPRAACVAVLAACTAAWASGEPTPSTSGAATTRCGWFDNPTPGNVTLTDADGEWTIGQQGGHQATGRRPTFSASRWVRTGNGSYGYGCACMRVLADAQSGEVKTIVDARSRPLAACRGDLRLQGKEPANPAR